MYKWVLSAGLLNVRSKLLKSQLYSFYYLNLELCLWKLVSPLLPENERAEQFSNA